MATDGPITIQQRYSTAINTSDLTVDGKTSRSASDVLGAFGLAARRLETGFVPTGEGEGYNIPKAPLAVALERLFAGDHGAGAAIVEILAAEAFRERRKMKVQATYSEVVKMAHIALRWHQDNACPVCKGHGYALIEGAPTLGDRECGHCVRGKVSLEDAVDKDKTSPGKRELVRWMASALEREAGRAGPEAIRALAERMNFGG